jgi:hypothetical protein
VKALALPANIRRDWKGFARDKHSSLLRKIANYVRKNDKIDTWGQNVGQLNERHLLDVADESAPEIKQKN